MRPHPCSPMTHLLIPALCLTAAVAQAQDWEALKPRISNQSRRAWTVFMGNPVEAWAWGYTIQRPSGGDAAPAAFEGLGKVHLSPGQTMGLYVKRPGAGPGGGEASLFLEDLPEQQGRLSCRLTVNASASDSHVAQWNRTFGHHPEDSQMVIVSPASIIIAERHGGLPPATESKDAPAMVTEKLQDAVSAMAKSVSAKEGAEAAGKQMYAHDKLAAEFQAMIFAWMKEGYGAYVAKYRDAAAELRPDAGDFLADYLPDFLSQSKYREIYDKAVTRDSLPVDHVGDIKLPGKKGD